MEQSLTKQLDRLTAHYQPIVDLANGDVVGFEALARIAEDGGEARSVGPIIDQIESDPVQLDKLMWQLLGAIKRDVKPHFDRYPGFYVGVNVPPAILGSGKILTMLEQLEMVPYLPRLLCEVTERQSLTDQGRTALATARHRHLRVALDDFGTGYSGLSQLLGQTYDVLKIDHSQIDNLLRDPTADRLVRGIVALANVLRAKTVAEGVESAAQALFLYVAGVDYGQGWFWSKALAPQDLPRVIEMGFVDQRRDMFARLQMPAPGS